MQTAKLIGKWAILATSALFGPNAIMGSIIGVEMNRPNRQTIQNIANKIGAIDSIPLGPEAVLYFTETGFIPLNTYGITKNSTIPRESPYRDWRQTLVIQNSETSVQGCIRYKTPMSYQPPKKPRIRERLLLGRELYDRLTKEAESYAKEGAPELIDFEFEFTGESSQLLLQLMTEKVNEYVETI